MNILYICPRFPYPPREGDKVVIYNHLKYLSGKNKITLLTMIGGEKELEGLEGLTQYGMSVETFKRRNNFSVINFLTALCSIAPFTVIRYHSPAMFKRAKELIESGRFDVVHVSQYYMSQYAIDKRIAVPKNTVTILDTHHIQYLIYLNFTRHAKNPFIKFLTFLETMRIKGYELNVYKKFDKCIAVNNIDKDVINKLSGASNIEVVPFPMAVPSSPVSGDARRRNDIIFFGTLKSLPNKDGLIFFYKEIFPLIKKEIPDARFIVGGEDPAGLCRPLYGDPGVEVVGLIRNIREFIKDIPVVVVPLRVLGGGITMKILESWASAKAVVSTSRAAEGIPVENNVDILLADSAADFAKAVIALLRDEKRRKDIGEAAFKKIREIYNPEKIIAGLEEIYKNAIKEKLIKNG